MYDKSMYLGVRIKNKIDWNPHINSTLLIANRCIGFINRNISHCPQLLRELAYLSLVISQLEYFCVAWDPYQIKDIPNLEKTYKRQQDVSNKMSQNITV